MRPIILWINFFSLFFTEFVIFRYDITYIYHCIRQLRWLFFWLFDQFIPHGTIKVFIWHEKLHFASRILFQAFFSLSLTFSLWIFLTIQFLFFYIWRFISFGFSKPVRSTLIFWVYWFFFVCGIAILLKWDDKEGTSWVLFETWNGNISW